MLAPGKRGVLYKFNESNVPDIYIRIVMVMDHTSSTGAVPMVRVATAQVHHVNLLLSGRAGSRRRVSWPFHLIAYISAVSASGVCSSMHKGA